jgi:16S rRNA processing protein RimM
MSSPAADPLFVVVGHISKPHGTKGEVYVWPLTDRAETTFLPGVDLRFSDAEGEWPDPELPRALISEVRPYRRGFLVLFDGIGDRTGAEIVRERYLLRPFDETEPLEEGEVFYHQLLGMSVVTADGAEVGTIREVYDLRPAAMLEVESARGERLIPFTRKIVLECDIARRRVVIDPPSGLLDL